MLRGYSGIGVLAAASLAASVDAATFAAALSGLDGDPKANFRPKRRRQRFGKKRPNMVRHSRRVRRKHRRARKAA